MDKTEALFLESLRCAIREEDLSISEKPEQTVLRRLFRLAREQSVVPLIAQAISGCEGLRDDPLVSAFLREARSVTLHQAARTGDFLLLLGQLDALGLHPAVLKGIICRGLYPEPEQRPSTDEDLLIPPEDFTRYHEALLSCGFRPKNPDLSPEGEYELTYGDPERDLWLEVHLSLFPHGAEAFGDCNLPFEGLLSRLAAAEIYGRRIYTLRPSDHLLYLLCHAYKHVLYGGIGVRQICDLSLYAERFASEIDWDWIRSNCEQLQILTLSSAFFRIGERFLGIPAPSAFSGLAVEELPLLADCLSGGIYGAEDPDRLHSSRITLNAVAASRRGRARNGIWSSLFPGKGYLQNNYPYARAHPWLTPVAWFQRLWNYASGGKQSVGKSLKIGRERVELLRRYKIID